MSTERERILYGAQDGRWLIVDFVYPQGQECRAPASIGPLVRLGTPNAALAQLYDRIREQQQEQTQKARIARAAHDRAVRAWEAEDPATRGTAPERPDGWQPAKRGPRPGVQQQLSVLIGVGQQAVSRYLNHGTGMALPDGGWTALVSAWFREMSDR
ncbi:hypothetical protein [Streptomyces sp. NPDC094468]|uniref:hypothetical protein n=1 Tax=Streptomyces sp. NPDC094468 TaxID=3366066 RepID=UPI003816504A